MVEILKEKCIGCGHCYAVCLPDQSEEGVIEFGNCKPAIDSELMLNFIKSRRSIRNYQDKKIETQIMEHILILSFKAGSRIPQSKNATA